MKGSRVNRTATSSLDKDGRCEESRKQALPSTQSSGPSPVCTVPRPRPAPGTVQAHDLCPGAEHWVVAGDAPPHTASPPHTRQCHTYTPPHTVHHKPTLTHPTTTPPAAQSWYKCKVGPRECHRPELIHQHATSFTSCPFPQVRRQHSDLLP